MGLYTWELSWLYIFGKGSSYLGVLNSKKLENPGPDFPFIQILLKHIAWECCRQNVHLWLSYLFNRFPLYRPIFRVSKRWAPPVNSVFTSFSLCCSIASPPSSYFSACAWWASEIGTCLGMHKPSGSLMKTTEHDPNSLTVWILRLYLAC